MSYDPITIEAAASMRDATELMRTNEIRHLPVVDSGRLVGMVTINDIRKASPSPATTFSVGEVNYLVDQVRVRDIMTPDPVTVSPDAGIVDAALLGYRHGYGSLPVVQDGRLVGIITQRDLFRMVMQIFEAEPGDSQITIEDMPAKLGTIGNIVDILDRHQVRFSTFLTFPQRDSDRYTYWLRVHRGDVGAAVEDLEAAGYPRSLVVTAPEVSA